MHACIYIYIYIYAFATCYAPPTVHMLKLAYRACPRMYDANMMTSIQKYTYIACMYRDRRQDRYLFAVSMCYGVLYVRLIQGGLLTHYT